MNDRGYSILGLKEAILGDEGIRVWTLLLGYVCSIYLTKRDYLKYMYLANAWHVTKLPVY